MSDASGDTDAHVLLDKDEWPDLMDVHEAAGYLRCGPEQVRVLCREGDLKHGRNSTGRRSALLIRKAWLDEFIDGNAKGGYGPAHRRPAPPPCAHCGGQGDSASADLAASAA